MAFFGKSRDLAEALKRLETGGIASAEELDALLEAVRTHPDWRPERTLWMLRSPTRRIREFAEQHLLGRNDLDSLVSPLAAEIVATPVAARPEMARVAARLAGSRLPDLLATLARSDAADQREAALEIIATQAEGRAWLPLLKASLNDPVPELRRKGARVLARSVENPSVFVMLRDRVHDEDAEVRRIVIEAFARRPGPDVVEPFFERLPLEAERERATIVKALSALARTSQAEIEERVMPMLCDENAAVREMAVRLLSEMPDRTRLLRTFCLHSRGLAFWLRERSLASIRTISGSLTGPLLELMQPGEEEDVRVGAMLLARGSEDPRIRARVQEIFTGDHDWWIRSTAAEVLGDFPGEETSRILISRLREPDLRLGIIALLGERGGAAVNAALLDCLRDPNNAVRRAALDALARSGRPENLGMLLQVAGDDPDAAVREKAASLLEALGEAASGHLAARAAADDACDGLCMQNEELNRPRAGADPPA